jgi:hypothetical protein
VIRLAHDQSVHWIAVLSELASFGLNDGKVADQIGATADRVRKWRQVRCNPNGNDALRLLVLWSDVTGKAAASAPIISLADDWEV